MYSVVALATTPVSLEQLVVLPGPPIRYKNSRGICGIYYNPDLVILVAAHAKIFQVQFDESVLFIRGFAVL